MHILFSKYLSFSKFVVSVWETSMVKKENCSFVSPFFGLKRGLLIGNIWRVIYNILSLFCQGTVASVWKPGSTMWGRGLGNAETETKKSCRSLHWNYWTKITGGLFTGGISNIVKGLSFPYCGNKKSSKAIQLLVLELTGQDILHAGSHDCFCGSTPSQGRACRLRLSL